MTFFQKIKDNISLVISLVFFWILILIQIYLILVENQGHFLYANDDIYIHMAISKNFALYGVWGVTKYEFSSSASSILYPLLLALCFKIFGVNYFIPLIINLVIANLFIFYFFFILQKKLQLNSYVVLICLICSIIFIPISRNVLVGMEHLIHILLSLIFVYKISNSFDNDEEPNFIIKFGFLKLSVNEIQIIILGVLLTLTRFESIALILIVSLLFFINKRYFYSIFLFILGFLPIILYGLISVLLGWNFLPNSVLIKGIQLDIYSLSSIYDFINGNLKKIFESVHLLILLAFASFFILIHGISSEEDLWKSNSVISIVFIFTSLFQTIFAQSGLRSRYDGYLIIIGILMIVLSVKDLIPEFSLERLIEKIKNFKKNLNFVTLYKNGVIISCFIILISPFLYRSVLITTDVQATKNIYQQQYQMGLFLSEYYEGKVIAVNDIGAVNYFADIRCVDLWGLSDIDYAELILNNNFNSETIDQLARSKNVTIALINANIDVPGDWIEVGKWTRPYSVLGSSASVSFYAVELDEMNNLILNLQEFSSSLPPDVIESGIYIQ